MMTHSKNCDGESGDGMDPGSPCNCDGPTLTEMVNDFVANFVEFECNDAALAVLNDLIASATVGATARLAAAEARAEKAEAEVRYLRARMAWMAARADLGNRTGGHGLRDYIDWLDANPEPQPPPGVEP